MPTKYYDLNSAYGTEDELRQLLKGMKEDGIVGMLDFVANHRCGVLINESINLYFFIH